MESSNPYDSNVIVDPVREKTYCVDGHELKDWLGRGGGGAVYRDPRDSSRAIKVLPHVDNQTAIMRFVQEIELLINEEDQPPRLSHPGVVRVHGHGRTDDEDRAPYFVMDYVAGPTLDQLIHGGNLTAADALDVCEKVADALAAVHAAGVIHRDVKPKNVVIKQEGGGKRPVLIDFGIAKDVESDHQFTGTDSPSPGTIGYVAPEPVKEYKTDVYSLGIVLEEMLDSLGESGSTTQSDASGERELRRRLYDVVEHCTKKTPSERYNVATLLEALARVRRGEDPLTGPSRWRRAADWSRQSAVQFWNSVRALRIATCVLLAAVIVLVIAAAVAWNPTNDSGNPPAKIERPSAVSEVSGALRLALSVNADALGETRSEARKVGIQFSEGFLMNDAVRKTLTNDQVIALARLHFDVADSFRRDRLHDDADKELGKLADVCRRATPDAPKLAEWRARSLHARAMVQHYFTSPNELDSRDLYFAARNQWKQLLQGVSFGDWIEPEDKDLSELLRSETLPVKISTAINRAFAKSGNDPAFLDAMAGLGRSYEQLAEWYSDFRMAGQGPIQAGHCYLLAERIHQTIDEGCSSAYCTAAKVKTLYGRNNTDKKHRIEYLRALVARHQHFRTIERILLSHKHHTLRKPADAAKSGRASKLSAHVKKREELLNATEAFRASINDDGKASVSYSRVSQLVAEMRIANLRALTHVGTTRSGLLALEVEGQANGRDGDSSFEPANQLLEKSSHRSVHLMGLNLELLKLVRGKEGMQAVTQRLRELIQLAEKQLGLPDLTATAPTAARLSDRPVDECIVWATLHLLLAEETGNAELSKQVHENLKKRRCRPAEIVNLSEGRAPFAAVLKKRRDKGRPAPKS